MTQNELIFQQLKLFVQKKANAEDLEIICKESHIMKQFTLDKCFLICEHLDLKGLKYGTNNLQNQRSVNKDFALQETIFN